MSEVLSDGQARNGYVSAFQRDHPAALSSPTTQTVRAYKHMMGLKPLSTSSTKLPEAATGSEVADGAERISNEQEETEIFSKVGKTRVRYDVEVVTKLVVYAGMSGQAVISPAKAVFLTLLC